MNAEHGQNDFGATQPLSAHLLNLPPPPRYETAGARSTRMIIDSASYATTPCSSPPSEPSHVFSAYDSHHKVPDVTALTEEGHVLDQQMNQNDLRHHIASCAAQAELPALRISLDKEHAPSNGTRHRQGIIPPYMLQAIANSEAAEPQARASAEQTLSSSKPATHGPALRDDYALIAPAQRQLRDGRWTIGF